MITPNITRAITINTRYGSIVFLYIILRKNTENSRYYRVSLGSLPSEKDICKREYNEKKYKRVHPCKREFFSRNWSFFFWYYRGLFYRRFYYIDRYCRRICRSIKRFCSFFKRSRCNKVLKSICSVSDSST